MGFRWGTPKAAKAGRINQSVYSLLACLRTENSSSSPSTLSQGFPWGRPSNWVPSSWVFWLVLLLFVLLLFVP
jgi:protein-S-isoprenylcysteine O-methyltransferase Ste14